MEFQFHPFLDIEIKLFKSADVSSLEREINQFFKNRKTIKSLNDQETFVEDCKLDIHTCSNGEVLISVILKDEHEEKDNDE
jgi:uncharacterized ubiquitin-like protein YukD